MSYTTGQTANLNVGPITNVITNTVYDPSPLTLTVTEPDGTIAHTFTYGTDAEIIKDDTGVYHANILLPTAGMWKATWAWGSGDDSGESNHVLWAQDEILFATASQVAARLGRDLTAAEASQALALLQLATAAITDAAGKDDAWAAALNPIPPGIRVLCVELAARVLQNPKGVRSQQEQLGAYLHSETYDQNTGGAGGIALSDNEKRQVRRALFGSGAASVRVGAIIDDATVADHFDQGLDDYEGS